MTDLYKKFKKTGWNPFETYKVKLHLRDLVGGIPQQAELVEAWVNSKCKSKTDEQREEIRDAHLEKLGELTDGARESKGIGFHRLNGELVIEGRQVKAMLKEVANIIKDIAPTSFTPNSKMKMEDLGVPALRKKASEQLFVEEEFIPIGRKEPDEIREKPIHVMTRQGQRDSIKVYEICHDVDIEFTLHRMKGAGKMALPEATMVAILEYGKKIGLGADRSQGRGLFEVVEIKKVG
jgi:hypothetical protein